MIHAFHITFVKNEPIEQVWWSAYCVITIEKTMKLVDSTK